MIGRYKCDEMTLSIEVAKKIAGCLDTTVGCLVRETERDLFKDPGMLERRNDIVELPEEEKEALLMSIDAFLPMLKQERPIRKNKAPIRAFAVNVTSATTA